MRFCLPANLLPGEQGGMFHSKTAIPYQEFPDAKKSIKGVLSRQVLLHISKDLKKDMLVVPNKAAQVSNKWLCGRCDPHSWMDVT